MRPRFDLVGVFLVVLSLITAVLPVSTANAANCVMADLQPTLAQFMVTQGVGDSQTTTGYATLTRGKETLVKLFLTLPSTCTVTNGQYVRIATASLDVSTGSASNTLFTGYGSPQLLPAAIQGYSVADPVFIVPSANLVPAPSNASFTPTIKATITFNRSDGVSTQTGQTRIFCSTALTAPCAAPAFNVSGKKFETLTNALRVLVVPMGDKTKAFTSQYTTADQQIVQNAMQALSRLYPTTAGVADLTVASGGIRYVVDTATMLDLPSTGAYVNGKFCGSSLNFTTIKGLLAQYLAAHNTANKKNPLAIADRVVGVVGGNGSLTGPISLGTEDNSGCADGMASVSSPESWVRLIADASGKPSRTGSLMGMEVAHTFGLELLQSSYHSPLVEADGGTDRAYNLSTRSRIQYDHTVMDFNNTGGSSWDDTTTLLEPKDFAYLLCQLAPGSLSVACTPGKVGSSTGVPAGEQYIIAGTTDGTPEHTTVIEPYYDLAEFATAEDPASLLRLIQLDTSTVPPTLIPGPNCSLPCRGFGVPWSPAVTHEGTTLSTVWTFYAAAPGFTDKGAGEVRLVKVTAANPDPMAADAPVLFSSRKVDPPVIRSITGGAIPPSGGKSTLFRTQITPRIPPKPDIVFLADTTASMATAIGDVRDNIGSIMTDVLNAQPDARFAAASYKDNLEDEDPAICPNSSYADPYVFRIEQALTADPSAVEAAITPPSSNPNHLGWEAFGGCDGPEAQLNALFRLGIGNDDVANKDVGWTGSSSIVAWFGDAPGHSPSNGHSLPQAITALGSRGIRVVAVDVNQLDGTATFCSPVADCSGQATQITNATHGVLKKYDSKNPKGVSDAILQGLHDLDATVTPWYDGYIPDASYDGCKVDGVAGPLSVRFVPAEATVRGGTSVNFTETVTVAASDPGIYTCRVFFKINGQKVQRGGTDDPAYFQNISIVVSDQTQSTVTVTATKSSANPLLLDLIYECNLFNFVAAIAVAPIDQNLETATFTANADTTNACANAGGGGKLVPYVSDLWNRVGSNAIGGVQTETFSAPKVPTAAIYSPAIGSSINWDGTLALRGSGEVAGVEIKAEDPCLNATPARPGLTWSLTAPGGMTTVLSQHSNSVDVMAQTIGPNGWTQGTWTATLTACYEGRISVAATRNFTLFNYQFLGFFSPVLKPPAVNKITAGSTFTLKWQLKSGSTLITDVSTVSSTTYAMATACSPSGAAVFAQTSGQSVLKFDSKNMQFVFTWQTPSTPTGLYIFRLTLTDGSIHDACVQLTK
jgi:hypothetical protein